MQEGTITLKCHLYNAFHTAAISKRRLGSTDVDYNDYEKY